ncbi:hypothetical protein GUJ93_ZPchr0011g28917 [Zizania palustris]|uniref:Disease resistance R13L4/SHOC-2-like LRR domain-containing protein n=1 Tax=Zizania palustris TaxID=103762 RepID=A0A8J6BL41_ZIZPA|nr:hypothetical protein GUJ93_ZPchr0011g28917 [Zizania palustris]
MDKKIAGEHCQAATLNYFLANGAQLPDGVGKMKLQELSGVSVYDECSVSSLLELGSLTNLRILRLNWYVSESRNDRTHCTDALASSLGKLAGCRLKFLSINRGPFSADIPFDSWPSSPHLLSELYIPRFCFQRIPDWMASVTNLCRLGIRVKQVTQQVLQILGDLPALLDLELWSAADDHHMETLIVCSNIFRCLKIFRLYGSMVRLVFEAGAMQMIKEISIVVRAHEVQSACADHPDLGIHHLSSLMNLNVWINCEGARAEEVKVLEDVITDATNLLPNHPTPHFYRENEENMVKDDEAHMHGRMKQAMMFNEDTKKGGDISIE